MTPQDTCRVGPASTDPQLATCALCSDPVDPDGPRTWRQVTVWVHGPKANGACMQGTDVLGWAHDTCAQLARRGIPVGQVSML